MGAFSVSYILHWLQQHELLPISLAVFLSICLPEFPDLMLSFLIN